MTALLTAPRPAADSSRGRRRWLTRAALVALAAAAGGAAYHFGLPLLHHDAPATPVALAPSAEDAVRVTDGHLIRVTPDTPLARNLHTDAVRRESVASPLVTVTGNVAARRGPEADGHWDFASADVASAYGDWAGARADAEAAAVLLTKVRELVDAKVANYKQSVERYRGLMESGAGAAKDYAQAQADLLQGQIQGATDVYQAEVTLRGAQRKKALVDRQLLQFGVDPAVLAAGRAGTALVVADVPEARVGDVRQGQACEARFVAYPGEVFAAKVGRLGPSLAKESRTLRVIFELDDPQGKLRPGLFADIGLGTEPRDVLTVAAAAVLHVGRADYVLAEAGPDRWQVTPVRVVEPHDGRVEVTGVPAGTRVLSTGAILLKPLAVRALRDGGSGK